MMPALFIVLALLSFALFYLGTGRDKRVFVTLSFWIVVTGLLSYMAFFQNVSTVPPRFVFVVLPAALLVIFFYSILKNKQVNVRYLLAIHALRLPVELFLFQLFLEKKVPIQMTYKGWNMDIFSGISALILLLYLLVSQKSIHAVLFRIWNIMGLILLFIIVATAILSAPLPFQQLAFEQPNVAVLEFPYTFLPAVIVPLVLLSHLLGLKNSVQKKF